MSLHHHATLVVFSNGDARDARTWSNVPYMFTTAFERAHPETAVATVNIRLEDSHPAVLLMTRLWNHFMTPRLGSLCTFDRTRLYGALVSCRMRRVCRQMCGQKRNGILLAFDFSNLPPATEGFKTCLLCDWTIEYEIAEHRHRKPTRAETRLIRRQRNILRKADHVVSLFPHSARTMEESTPGLHVAYFGLPGNLTDSITPCFDRWNSNRLIFIGGNAYKDSLATVVKGLREYNAHHPDTPLFLDVIGMNASGELGDENIVFHGYLRKDIPAQRETYYDLLRHAKALVTVSDRWVGASSIIEAMILGTPVITTPNPEIREMLGAPDFGYWCEYSSKAVEYALEKITQLSAQQLNDMCHAAEAKTHDMTWNGFIEQWVGLMAADRREGREEYRQS